MFNLVVLTGRLTADPELKTTQSGISVTLYRFRVYLYKMHKTPPLNLVNFIEKKIDKTSPKLI